MTFNKQQLILMTSGNVKVILITKYAYRKQPLSTVIVLQWTGQYLFLYSTKRIVSFKTDTVGKLQKDNKHYYDCIYSELGNIYSCNQQKLFFHLKPTHRETPKAESTNGMFIRHVLDTKIMKENIDRLSIMEWKSYLTAHAAPRDSWLFPGI